MMDCIGKLRSQGYKIIATTPHSDSVLLSEFEVTDKVKLFFGTERDGLRGEVLKEAYGFLKTTMKDLTEGLNIFRSSGNYTTVMLIIN